MSSRADMDYINILNLSLQYVKARSWLATADSCKCSRGTSVDRSLAKHGGFGLFSVPFVLDWDDVWFLVWFCTFHHFSLGVIRFSDVFLWFWVGHHCYVSQLNRYLVPMSCCSKHVPRHKEYPVGRGPKGLGRLVGLGALPQCSKTILKCHGNWETVSSQVPGMKWLSVFMVSVDGTMRSLQQRRAGWKALFARREAELEHEPLNPNP